MAVESPRRRRTPDDALEKRLGPDALKVFDEMAVLSRRRSRALESGDEAERKRVLSGVEARRAEIRRQLPTERIQMIEREIIEESSRHDDPVVRRQRSELGASLRQRRRMERGKLWKPHYHHHSVSRGVKESERTRQTYNNLHGVDFFEEVDSLMRRFPGEVIRVLDVGCGRGLFLRDLTGHAEKKGAGNRIDVQGVTLRRKFWVDGNQERMVGPVLPTGPDGNIHVGHAAKLPFDDNSFHLVVSTVGGPTYSRDEASAIRECYRVTAPGGSIYLSHDPKVSLANCLPREAELMRKELKTPHYHTAVRIFKPAR